MNMFCFVVAVFILVHDEEAIFQLLTVFEILICKCKYEWASNLLFHEHHSYFRKDFQMM